MILTPLLLLACTHCAHATDQPVTMEIVQTSVSTDVAQTSEVQVDMDAEKEEGFTGCRTALPAMVAAIAGCNLECCSDGVRNSWIKGSGGKTWTVSGKIDFPCPAWDCTPNGASIEIAKNVKFKPNSLAGMPVDVSGSVGVLFGMSDAGNFKVNILMAITGTITLTCAGISVYPFVRGSVIVEGFNFLDKTFSGINPSVSAGVTIYIGSTKFTFMLTMGRDGEIEMDNPVTSAVSQQLANQMKDLQAMGTTMQAFSGGGGRGGGGASGVINRRTEGAYAVQRTVNRARSIPTGWR